MLGYCEIEVRDWTLPYEENTYKIMIKDSMDEYELVQKIVDMFLDHRNRMEAKGRLEDAMQLMGIPKIFWGYDYSELNCHPRYLDDLKKSLDDLEKSDRHFDF